MRRERLLTGMVLVASSWKYEREVEMSYVCVFGWIRFMLGDSSRFCW